MCSTVVPQQNYVGVLIDDSRSMRIADGSQSPRSAFVANAFAPDDGALLRALGAKFQLRFFRFSSGAERMADVSELTFDGTRTQIAPALDRAREELAPVPLSGLVVISDGADTASDHDIKGLRTELRRNDAFVYALAIDAPGRRPVSGRVDPYALRDITDDSGGYTEVVHDSADLVAATARIADELNHQYLLGYVPPRGADRQYHSIRLRTREPGYRVRARKGYVAAE